MSIPQGCSSWLFIATVIGVITCLLNEVWVPPFKPFYGWRLFLVLLLMILAIRCFLGA